VVGENTVGSRTKLMVLEDATFEIVVLTRVQFTFDTKSVPVENATQLDVSLHFLAHVKTSPEIDSIFDVCDA
jgi:hypothetical protein